MSDDATRSAVSNLARRPTSDEWRAEADRHQHEADEAWIAYRRESDLARYYDRLADAESKIARQAEAVKVVRGEARS